jgi:hypothetical protein
MNNHFKGGLIHGRDGGSLARWSEWGNKKAPRQDQGQITKNTHSNLKETTNTKHNKHKEHPEQRNIFNKRNQKTKDKNNYTEHRSRAENNVKHEEQVQEQ